ncbi:helix-turn-helix transcriptional regulator [Catenovulum maritimum]|uniref:HTH araC/xylS-type domain-containing protein n=1 Tax=Catenovulum maritimum TaxID=1513271 RepID=A0A0J8GVC7_9ALTE|nr:helix-turn-helix domain-containing protein [Catenovulum maritimum]KMT66740.1 hypothetical protein XM47_01035 [Catenovulum maritimum]
MQISWHLFSVGVVTFSAAIIFAMVLTYFTLVRSRIGLSYRYYSLFFGTVIFYLSGPILSMLPFEQGKILLHISCNFLLFSLGVPALTQALFIQSGYHLKHWQTSLPYILGSIWSCFHALTFEITYPKTYFDISPIFHWESQLGLTANHIYYSHILLVSLILTLPCIYLLKRNQTNNKANIYIYGAFNFCFFLCLGILLKAWALYYAGMSLTALIWAWAIFSDIQKTHHQLQHSYAYEKQLAAVQYAASGNGLSVTELYPETVSENYPFRQQSELLDQVKNASVGLIADTTSIFVEELNKFANQQPDLLKARVREMLFLLYDMVILHHGNAKKLIEQLEHKGKDIDKCQSTEQLNTVLREEALRLASICKQNTSIELTNPLVESTKKYILAHYHQALSISSIAESLNVSHSYLMATFKKETQQTINQYLIDVRINKAKQLLLNSSITQTAYDVGFNNSNYFSTVFKKQTGLTPKSYQQKAKADS